MAEARHRIRVVDTDGNPVADAMIAVETSDVPFPEISLITDRDGRVGLLFRAGHYRIGARAIDGRYGFVDAEIGAGDAGLELTIVVRDPDPANPDG